MPPVRAPMIGIKPGEPEGLQQSFQLQEDRILTTPKDIRQDGSGGMMLGRRKARYSAARFLALSQITENRKVEAHKPWIFRNPFSKCCLNKATLRQSRLWSPLVQPAALVYPLSMAVGAWAAPHMEARP